MIALCSLLAGDIPAAGETQKNDDNYNSAFREAIDEADRFQNPCNGVPAAVDLILSNEDVISSKEAAVSFFREIVEKGRNPVAVAVAADVLGNIGGGDPSVTDTLIKALGENSDECRRWWLIAALGNLGDPKAIPMVVRTMKEGDPTTAALAAQVLGDLGVKSVVPGLIEALNNGNGGAAVALCKHPEPSAVTALINAFNRNNVDAACSLGKIGGALAIKELSRKLFEAPREIRMASALALAEVKDPSVFEPLAKSLQNDPDPGVRGAVVNALGMTGDDRARKILRQALNDDSTWVRRCAQETIKKLETRQGLRQTPGE